MPTIFHIASAAEWAQARRSGTYTTSTRGRTWEPRRRSLTEEQTRRRMGTSVTGMASPSATLLTLAFRPGRRLGLPRGADRDDLAAAFSAWRLDDVQDADTTGMPGPLKSTRPQWFRLVRAG